jgi:hypothetical protein
VKADLGWWDGAAQFGIAAPLVPISDGFAQDDSPAEPMKRQHNELVSKDMADEDVLDAMCSCASFMSLTV